MDWISLETCLGPDWVEPNVMWPPTGSPTVSPSQRPTNGPSESPSYMPSSSEPTASPSSRAYFCSKYGEFMLQVLITSCAPRSS
jgi:hypothetical protein